MLRRSTALLRWRWPRINGEVEAAAVVGWDAYSGGVGEPLLRHDLPFGSDGLTCHADPSALDEFGTSGQQAGSRASKGIRVHGATASWVGAAAAGANRQGQAQATPQSDLHRLWRDAACLVARYGGSGMRSRLGAEKST